MMQDALNSLMAANEVLSHSVLSSSLLEQMQKLTSEHAPVSLNAAALALTTKQFKPFMSDVLKDTFAKLFTSPNLASFYNGFNHIEEVSSAAQSIMATVRLDALGDLIGVIGPRPPFGLMRLGSTSHTRIMLRPSQSLPVLRSKRRLLPEYRCYQSTHTHALSAPSQHMRERNQMLKFGVRYRKKRQSRLRRRCHA